MGGGGGNPPAGSISRIFVFLSDKSKCSAVSPYFTAAAVYFSCQKNPTKTSHEFELTGLPFFPWWEVSIFSLPYTSIIYLFWTLWLVALSLQPKPALPEKDVTQWEFLMPTHPFLICLCLSPLSHFFLLSCYRTSARKVMEQDKMVCTSVGWQRSEDAISLYSLNYRSLNALLRTCSSAADVSYRSLVTSVQPVWARQLRKALFTGFHQWS